MAKPEGLSWFAVYAPTDKLRLYFPNGDVRCAKCEWLSPKVQEGGIT